MSNIKYNKEQIESIFKTIIQRIELGESLRAILKDNGMPSRPLFFQWLKEDEIKINQYARATEIRADLEFDYMLEIADDSTNDYMTKVIQGEKVEVLNTENLQRSRLRIDTRKWILARMNPKKYGEKLDQNINHSGEIKTNDLSKMPTDELIKRAKAIETIENEPSI